MASSWNGTSKRPPSRVGVLVQCRDRLITGEWPPGYVLQEKRLAEELGVGKTPVREALQHLAFLGMVKPYSRIGYIVTNIELPDMLEVFQFRALIEDELIHAVAAHPKAQSISLENLEDRENSFHRSLYQLVALPRMLDTLNTLIDQTARAITYVGLEKPLIESIADEHEPILDALKQHDDSLARALMTVHLRHLRDSLLSKLRQQLRESKNIL